LDPLELVGAGVGDGAGAGGVVGGATVGLGDGFGGGGLLGWAGLVVLAAGAG
jgi:hypothetical protein